MANHPSLSEIYSGIYIPEATNITPGVTITALTNYYLRVGDMVNIAGTITIDSTIIGVVAFNLNLPIDTSFSSTTQAAGTGVSYSNGTNETFAIYADTAVELLDIRANVQQTGSISYKYNLMYQIR